MKKIISFVVTFAMLLTVITTPLTSFAVTNGSSNSEEQSMYTITFTNEVEGEKQVQSGQVLSLSLSEKGSLSIDESALPQGEDAFFESSDTNIAFISKSTGRVSPRSAGETTVTVRHGTSSYGTNPVLTTFTLKITQPKAKKFVVMVDGEVVDEEHPMMIEGSEYKETAFYAQEEGQDELTEVTSGVTAEVEGEAASYVYAEAEYANGAYVSFERPGTAYINYTYGGKTVRVKAVSSFVPVESLSLDALPSEVILENLIVFLNTGDNYIGLNAISLSPVVTGGITPENASFRTISWESSDNSIAEYTSTHSNGFIGHGEGTIKAKATINQGTYAAPVTAQKDVTFKFRDPVTSVTTAEENITINVGETKNLDIAFQPTKPTQTQMNWTQNGKGSVEVRRKNPTSSATKPSKKFTIKGVKAGELTLVGTPVAYDRDLPQAPTVTYHVTVVGDSTEEEMPTDAAVGKIKEAALAYYNNENPYIKTYGAEWNIYTMSRIGIQLTDAQLQEYKESINSTIDKGRKLSANGIATDIERVALALAQIGENPRNYHNTDLIKNILNNERLTESSNRVVWALQLLNGLQTDGKADEKWNKKKLVSESLEFFRTNGSFSLSKTDPPGPYVDMTAMAIQALAPYYNSPEVKEKVDEGLEFIKTQLIDGYNFSNPETSAQVIMALCALGKDPLTEEGFYADGKSLFDGITPFIIEGRGLFHYEGQMDPDPMATYQSMLAVKVYEDFKAGKLNGIVYPLDPSVIKDDVSENSNLISVVENMSQENGTLTKEELKTSIDSNQEISDKGKTLLAEKSDMASEGQLLDIRFVDENQEKVSVTSPTRVTVTISFDPNENFKVYHLKDDDTLEEITAESNQLSVNGRQVSFVSDSFSPFLFINETAEAEDEESISDNSSNGNTAETSNKEDAMNSNSNSDTSNKDKMDSNNKTMSSVNTGDESNPIPYVLAILVLSAYIAVIIKHRRKEN